MSIKTPEQVKGSFSYQKLLFNPRIRTLYSDLQQSFAIVFFYSSIRFSWSRP